MKLELIRTYDQFDFIAISKHINLHRNRASGTYNVSIRNLARIVSCHPQTIKNYFKKLCDKGDVVVEYAILPTTHGEQYSCYVSEQYFETIVNYIVKSTRAKVETKVRLQNFLLSFQLFKQHQKAKQGGLDGAESTGQQQLGGDLRVLPSFRREPLLQEDFSYSVLGEK